jgi:alkylated DNA repair dioxygenase AlkB
VVANRCFVTLVGVDVGVEMVWQPSLLDSCPPGCDPTFEGAVRRDLGAGAWLEVVPRWVDGADTLFEMVLEAAPWGEHERHMYDRMVVEPRLTTRSWDSPPPVVGEMAGALSERYGRDLVSVSANLYRNGRDSVAWHGDRVGKLRDDTVVALVSLGSARRFLLRPAGGGASLRLVPAPGDLVVLGGTAQATWQHCVPKTAHAGPRISVMFRETY